MCRECVEIDMGFTTERFSPGTHMCMVYSDEQERKEVIANFIASGIAAGEKVSYFTNSTPPQTIDEWLKEFGVDVSSRLANFTISDAQTIYCPRGVFDPDEMIDTLKAFYKDAMAENYNACRVSGEMSWAVKNIPGADRLMEYEAKVNELSLEYPVTAVCQYDASQFDGTTIFECLKVHPYIIVKGQIIKNPYYIKPEEYFKASCR